MDSSHIKPKQRLDSVQALRAVAAIAVVTHHIRLFQNGAWGVDLFFVISGFIMCYVTAETGKQFLVKRIIRIVPLYWMGTIAIFLLAVVAPHLLKNTTDNLMQLFNSLAFIPFQKGKLVQPVLFLGWSLNYEMFFYVLFAISMAASHRYRVPICSIIIVGIVVAGHFVPSESVVLRFYCRPIILEFVFGMLCYVLLLNIAAHRPPPTFASRLSLSLIGLAILACIPMTSVFASKVAPVIRFGTLAALSFLFIVHGLSGVTLPRTLVLTGDASYSLYLFHPYLIQVFDKVFHYQWAHNIESYCLAGVVIILCCVLSVIFYAYVEKPVTEYLRSRFTGANSRVAPPEHQIEAPALSSCSTIAPVQEPRGEP